MTYAAPHHLVADGPVQVGAPYPRRRRVGGADSGPHDHSHDRTAVSLGLPTVGVPAS